MFTSQPGIRWGAEVQNDVIKDKTFLYEEGLNAYRLNEHFKPFGLY